MIKICNRYTSNYLKKSNSKKGKEIDDLIGHIIKFLKWSPKNSSETVDDEIENIELYRERPKKRYISKKREWITDIIMLWS